jgi:hypothetical protein
MPTAWTENEGRQYLVRVLDQRLPPLEGETSGIAPMVGEDIDYRADSFVQRMQFFSGKAQIVSGGVTEHTKVGHSVIEKTRPVKMATIGGDITAREQERGEFAGRSIPLTVGTAMARALDAFHNDTKFTGQVAHGIEGVYTHPGIRRVFMTQTVASGTTVDTMTSEILTALDSRMTATAMANPEPYSALACSPTQFQFLANTKRSSNVDRSILEDMIASRSAVGRPFVIVPMQKCVGAGPNGGDILIGFDQNSPDIGGYAVPSGRNIDRFPDFVKHGTVEMLWRGFTAGMVYDYPLEGPVIIVPSGS